MLVRYLHPSHAPRGRRRPGLLGGRSESTSPIATGGAYGDYGYQWWVTEFEGERMVLAAGFRGQLIAILPDRELVVVVASRNDLADPAFAAKAFDTGQAITMVETAIAPHFGD
jgi:CubicO group peptidase (beta-lactamase class C family)